MEPTVEEAFYKKLDNVVLNAKGRVKEVLEDDLGVTPHQRFIVEVHSGHTILVAHNLERAYRVPVKIGDVVEVRGTFVWNKYGGLLHNTHHDDRGEHEDGWVILGERKISKK